MMVETPPESSGMRPGERQVAPTKEGIRRDHVARYEWAARQIGTAHSVVDAACGVGYGSRILADAGHSVLGLDKEKAALEYARANYASSRVKFESFDAADPEAIYGCDFDASVCFETVEHVADPLPLLKAMRWCSRRLLASVPNESVFPYRNHAFHFRHYTREQFEALLNAAGWKVAGWFGQAGPESEVEPDLEGRTLIAICEHLEAA
jgi:2-polyprenyl-3-methyl-5-hydroxy-6-metoxy-1,4-benzoquinol methylase